HSSAADDAPAIGPKTAGPAMGPTASSPAEGNPAAGPAGPGPTAASPTPAASATASKNIIARLQGTPPIRRRPSRPGSKSMALHPPRRGRAADGPPFRKRAAPSQTGRPFATAGKMITYYSVRARDTR